VAYRHVEVLDRDVRHRILVAKHHVHPWTVNVPPEYDALPDAPVEPTS
jgi:hypothetical protein